MIVTDWGNKNMMMTSEWAIILDEADELSRMILSSEAAQALREAYTAVYSNELLVKEINTFQRMKDQYEDVQRFGKYHPDYKQIMKSIREQKRKLDLDEQISALKLAENDFQDILDDISLVLGKTVSDAVMVPVNNPFASSSSSCGSGCGTGGSCSCSV